MWEGVKKMICVAREERFNLEGSVWLALEELAKINQEDLHIREMVRYLVCSKDVDCYYVRPGAGYISMIDLQAYETCDFGNSSPVAVRDVPSDCLAKLLELSQED